MPNPTYTDLHVSTPLTNISIGWAQANAGKYNARRIFQSIGVMKNADKYYTYTQADLQRSQAERRAPGAEATVGGYRVSTGSYLCDRWALAHDITDPDRGNADPQFDLDSEAAEFITDQIELAAEKQFIDEFFTTSVWTGASSTGDMTGAAAPASTASGFRQWNDVASTPIEDLRGEMYHVESKTGFRPNVLSMGAKVWRSLADHPDFMDKIKYTQTGNFGTDLLASLLGLDDVIVMNAVINSAAEQATQSVDFIAGKNALLTYRPPSPGLRRPAAGYTFVWTGAGAPVQGARVKRYRLDRNESDRIEGETWLDFVQTSASLGAFFATAVA